MRHKIKVSAIALSVASCALSVGASITGTATAQANPGVCVDVPRIVRVDVNCFRDNDVFIVDNDWNNDGRYQPCDRCGGQSYPWWWDRPHQVAWASEFEGEGVLYGGTWFSTWGVPDGWQLAEWNGTVYWFCPW